MKNFNQNPALLRNIARFEEFLVWVEPQKIQAIMLKLTLAYMAQKGGIFGLKQDETEDLMFLTKFLNEVEPVDTHEVEKEVIAQAREQLPLPSEEIENKLTITVIQKSDGVETGRWNVFFKKQFVEGLAIAWEFVGIEMVSE